MQARMKSPAILDTKVFKAVIALGKTSEERGVPAQTLALTHLRASQINGCGFCVDMHSRELEKMGATDAQIYTVAAWRESPFFTGAERAALALTGSSRSAMRVTASVSASAPRSAPVKKGDSLQAATV